MMLFDETAQPTTAQPDAVLAWLHGLVAESRTSVVVGNQPLPLTELDTASIVLAGHLDLFMVTAGHQQHLARIECGQLVCGWDTACCAEGLAVVARGAPDTRVLQLPWRELQALASASATKAAVLSLLEQWLHTLARAAGSILVVQPDELLAPHAALSLAAGVVAQPQQGVLWLRPLHGLVALFDETNTLTLSPPTFVPVTPHTPLYVLEPAAVQVITTTDWLQQDQSWHGLRQFQLHVLARIAARHAAAEHEEQLRLARKFELQQATMQRALSQLAGLLQARPLELSPALDETLRDPLIRACHMVGAVDGITIHAPPTIRPDAPIRERVRRIAETSAVRTRQVALRGQWWRQDHGALLGALKQAERPVALLPITNHSYALFDPHANSTTPVTAAVAEQLAPFAAMFYRPFPHGIVSTFELLRFGLRGSRRDMQQVLLAAGLVSLLSLATPLAIALLIDTVIPHGTPGELLQVGLVLLVIALAITAFEVAQGLALLRVTQRMGSAVQAAVWDRLLSLPPRFFRGYTVGDLGDRAMGLEAIRSLVAGSVVGALLAGIISVVNLGFLLYLHHWLALAALGLVLVAAGSTVATGLVLRHYQQRLAEGDGRLSGMVLQFINGIAKFHVAGAQSRAFAVWARQFGEQRKLAFRMRTLENWLHVWNTAYIPLTTLALMSLVVLGGRVSMSPGVFLAFTSAFSQLLLGTLELGAALLALLAIGPIYARARPILHALPELNVLQHDPGRLAGSLELSHVSFRYRAQGPLVVDDVSLKIKPGEFVALVGSSGSGKSTLLRLLLGFEAPLSGTISYDHNDLARLDVRAVRQQIGVVLQHGKLQTGSILENIVGSSGLALNDAWEAARMAGLDEDIRRMPMGMQTLLTDGGSTLSGGQRQRLLIASALVKRPRIIFFDEATSALDNRTQQIVGGSLAQLQVTRVVIAHRLSTVRHADRIVVLEQGGIVQVGAYQELINRPGPFADLARRQML